MNLVLSVLPSESYRCGALSGRVRLAVDPLVFEIALRWHYQLQRNTVYKFEYDPMTKMLSATLGPKWVSGAIRNRFGDDPKEALSRGIRYLQKQWEEQILRTPPNKETILNCLVRRGDFYVPDLLYSKSHRSKAKEQVRKIHERLVNDWQTMSKLRFVPSKEISS